MSRSRVRRMREEIYHRMYEVEDRHWWFAAKRAIIRHLLRRLLGTSDPSHPFVVADLGCGCGKALEELPEGYSGVGLDTSQLAVDFCRMRGVDARVGSLPDDVDLASESCDAVILSDILEHVDNDCACAAAAANLLKPDGIMIVTVPAVPSLYSSWDSAHGHKRRYTRASLTRALAASGLDVHFISYYNTLLFAPAVLTRAVKSLFSLRETAELAVPPAPLNAILCSAFAAERFIVGRVPLPVGLSLIAVLRKSSR